MTVNSISSKYLQQPHEVARFHLELEPSEPDHSKCCPGIYFDAKSKSIQRHPGLYIKEFTCTSGHKLRLLTSSSLEWVQSSVERALGDGTVNEDELSAAILFYYELRDMLEEGATCDN